VLFFNHVAISSSFAPRGGNLFVIGGGGAAINYKKEYIKGVYKYIYKINKKER
jgi:hypothetical protein